MTIYENTFFVPNQLPYDIKGFFKDLDDMRDPGSLKYSRFYYYYSGMIAIDVSTGELYIWRERRPSDGQGVLPNDFVYLIDRENIFYDYTNKHFNFFPLVGNFVTLDQIITGEILPVTDGSGNLPPVAYGSNGISHLAVYLNGARQREGVNNDYTVDYNTGTITFNFPLVNNGTIEDVVLVDYIINN